MSLTTDYLKSQSNTKYHEQSGEGDKVIEIKCS